MCVCFERVHRDYFGVDAATAIKVVIRCCDRGVTLTTTVRLRTMMAMIMAILLLMIMTVMVVMVMI